MFIQKSLLSRLLSAAWTILFIAGLLWLAVHLLAEVWIWIVVIALIAIAIRLSFWWRRLRDDWL